ncbi:MAG: S8 family serine peptidase [Planctomycetes bacterium]|nr:S8 family serine peptidase [Planctomycetota bacterium]
MGTHRWTTPSISGSSHARRMLVAASAFALTAGTCFGSERGKIIEYQEVMGQTEFSGRLIVRPVQADAWQDTGLTNREIAARDTMARTIVEQYGLCDYVLQTDEYIIFVPRDKTENDVSASLMETGLFQYAEPDWIIYPLDCPNDSRFGNQWHHDSNRMQSCDGWTLHTGNPSVSVGICDTGIRTTHEDFQQHRLEGYNAVDRQWESQGGNIGAVHPHGTNTTGCAAANGNNGVGVAGVGWDLSHRMLRVSNSSGGGAYMSTLQHAARTAVESGDRVASVSYSGVDTSSNLTTATYVKSIGGLLVWAAGNDGRNLTYGNRDNDDIIVVGGTDSGDSRAYFSAYGQFVDLVAPGVSVYTTNSSSNSSYTSVNGTSFSTPLTAGLAALIWSYDPSLTPDEVEAALKSGCDDLGSGGVDNTYGYGRINVYGSLTSLNPGNQSPVANLAASPLSGNVPLQVDFDASGSYDPDGTITDYSWDYDGDGTYDESTGSSPYAQFIYTVANDYVAMVRVTDNEGATDTDTVTISVTEPGNEPPVANLSATPLSGDAPLLVDFNASSSYDPDGTIVDFSWDYDGDGVYDESTGASPYAQVEYTVPNDYVAMVRVTDDQGDTDTDTVTISVTDPGGGGDPESLAFDGFESRSFSGGTGNWVGSWFGGGDVRLRWKRESPHTGDGHVRMRGNSGYMERVVDLAGATDARLTFWAKVRSWESSDRAYVWVSEDGVNYSLVYTFTNSVSDNQYHYYDLDLSGYNMTSDFSVVFEAGMNSKKDYWYLDDIDIIGVP